MPSGLPTPANLKAKRAIERRQCIGKGFAMMEACLILAAIAQRFRLTLEGDQRVMPTPYVTLRPEPGPRMRLARR